MKTVFVILAFILSVIPALATDLAKYSGPSEINYMAGGNGFGGIGYGVGYGGTGYGTGYSVANVNASPTLNITPITLPDIPVLSGPNMIEYRGPYEKGIAGKVKPWKVRKSWSHEEAEGFYSPTDSASCKVFPIRKATNERKFISIYEDGMKVSTVAYLECTGTSDMEIWGTVTSKMKELKAGVVKEEAYAVTYSNKSKGWNIGLGGGVTGANDSGDRGGSVGGGTGFGSVETSPVANISVVFSILD